jgi:Na+-driven multidrug efflux pump
LAISLIRTVVVYVPLAIAANHFYGYMGIFIATATTNVLVGTGAWYWNLQSVRSRSQ